MQAFTKLQQQRRPLETAFNRTTHPVLFDAHRIVQSYYYHNVTDVDGVSLRSTFEEYPFRCTFEEYMQTPSICCVWSVKATDLIATDENHIDVWQTFFMNSTANWPITVRFLECKCLNDDTHSFLESLNETHQLSDIPLLVNNLSRQLCHIPSAQFIIYQILCKYFYNNNVIDKPNADKLLAHLKSIDHNYVHQYTINATIDQSASFDMENVEYSTWTGLAEPIVTDQLINTFSSWNRYVLPLLENLRNLRGTRELIMYNSDICGYITIVRCQITQLLMDHPSLGNVNDAAIDATVFWFGGQPDDKLVLSMIDRWLAYLYSSMPVDELIHSPIVEFAHCLTDLSHFWNASKLGAIYLLRRDLASLLRVVFTILDYEADYNNHNSVLENDMIIPIKVLHESLMNASTMTLGRYESSLFARDATRLFHHGKQYLEFILNGDKRYTIRNIDLVNLSIFTHAGSQTIFVIDYCLCIFEFSNELFQFLGWTDRKTRRNAIEQQFILNPFLTLQTSAYVYGLGRLDELHDEARIVFKQFIKQYAQSN